MGGVLEDMAEVRSARFAENFNSVHSVGEVFFVFDSLFVGGKKAGPPASGVEFGVGFKKKDATGPTMVFPFPFEVPVFAGEWAFGAAVSEDLIFVRGELFAPLFGGFFNGVFFVGHLVSLTLGSGGMLAFGSPLNTSANVAAVFRVSSVSMMLDCFNWFV